MLKRTDLHKYQEAGVDFIIKHKGCALLLEMGLGKSVTTLTAIADLIDDLDVERVLIIAPKKVAESTWAQEVAKWEHLKHLTVSVILGTAKQRTQAMQKDADIYVTSRDNVVWLLEQDFTFDMLVLDELTSFKSSKAKRFKALRKVRPLVKRCVGLTGTPTPNGLLDLWAQMYLVDLGASLGRVKTKYIEAFFSTFMFQGGGCKYTLKKGADKSIYKMIDKSTLTMKAEDYLELPPMVERTIAVPLSEGVRAAYDAFEKENVLQYVEETQDKPQNIVASSAAALCNKLCQFANGAVYNEDRLPVEMHQEKLDMLIELIESAQVSGESVLVFYQYQHDCNRIKARPELKGLRVRKYEGDDDLKDWNLGKIDVLLTHAASTAYGLNLQKGGHIVIWYGTGWNAELYLQGNARLHRQGQTQPTTIYRLVADATMDARALQAIDNKVSGQNAMLTALTEVTRKYIK